MREYDVVIIGGGSAGMASAITCFDHGVKNILILEKEDHLGGILNQCIHNGFGLHEFKEELSGPEYMQRFIDEIHLRNIEYKLNTMVSKITNDKIINYTNKVDGFTTIKANTIIFSTGCFERTAGAIQVPGDRPNGIITAGTAQRYLNIHGHLVGKRVGILGSGDIGLIMARRMTLEGAKVLFVAEIMPYSNGLERNIAQCLNDFDIPLYLSHSVSKVIGKSNLEKIVIQQVDNNFNFIEGTEKEFECDTLLLSIGLIPYVSLLGGIKCPMSKNGGPIVYDNMETLIPGIFACGNCVHVHDIVDYVTMEGREAARGVIEYLNDKKGYQNIDIQFDENISYVVPHKIRLEFNHDLELKFRVKKVIKNPQILIYNGDELIYKINKIALIPSEMININIKKEKINDISKGLFIKVEQK